MVNWSTWLQAGQAVLSQNWFSQGATQLKHLAVNIEPIFHENGTILHLSVLMNVENSRIPAGEALLQHYKHIATTPLLQYDASSLYLNTSKGSIELYTEDFDVETPMPLRKWFSSEDILGDFSVGFIAIPDTIPPEESGTCGPEAAFQIENGGIMGSGMAFIPVVPESINRQWNFTLTWNLENAPVGTRVASSFGERSPVSFVGTSETLTMTLFAVGPVKSYTNEDSTYGMYWLSETSFNATDLAAQIEVFSTFVADFFRDDNKEYRVFVRRHLNRCMAGMGYHRSFIFSWSIHSDRPVSAYFDLVAHETVHEWPLIEFEPPKGDAGVPLESFWAEGIADYYATVLPYHFGIWSEDEYVHNMNMMASRYFTNPNIHATYDELASKFWDNYLSNQMIYSRGFMYFVNLGTELQDANSEKSLDDLIRYMVEPRLRGDRLYDLPKWLSVVSAQLGNDTTYKQYGAILDGKDLIIPPSIGSLPFSTSYILQRQDQEMFELGFPLDVFHGEWPRVVRDLDLKSRAAIEGGVKDGDQIMQDGTGSTYDAMEFDGEMTMRVRRDGKEIDLRWWPRTWEKVESWQWVHV